MQIPRLCHTTRLKKASLSPAGEMNQSADRFLLPVVSLDMLKEKLRHSCNGGAFL
jgi:hypothetical protein